MAKDVMLSASRIQADNRLQPRALRLLRNARLALEWESDQAMRVRWYHSDRGEVVEVAPLGETLPEGWEKCALRRNGGAKGAEAIYINCRSILREIHEISPLSADPFHAEIEDGLLRVYLRETILPEVYGLRVWGNRRQKKTPIEGKRHEVHIDLMLYSETLSEVEKEAKAAGMPLRYYLRQVIEQRQPINPKTADACETHQERAHIVKKAMQADHTLSVEELTERGLPLCWNKEWLLARVAEGITYTEMARRYGGDLGVYAYWGRKFGISRQSISQRGALGA